MPRKPFKIVNNLDLSGNELRDVTKIIRADYNVEGISLDLVIAAGSDVPTTPFVPGGNLILKSGAGEAAGTDGGIYLYPGGDDDFGIKIDGSTKISLISDQQDILFTINDATTEAVKVTSDVDITAVTKNTGAFQVVGGAYVGKSLLVGDGKIYAATANASLFAHATSSGVVSIGDYATTLNLANSTTTEQTINIGTAGTAKTTTSVGTNASTSIVNLHAPTINLGTSTSTATTAKIGGAVSGNKLHIASTSASTIYVSTDVTTGTANVFDSVTGTVNFAKNASTMNIASAAVSTVNVGSGASTITLGGTNSTVYVGAASGTIDTKTAASTANVFNTNATTVNAFGAATTLKLGASSATFTLEGTTITFPSVQTMNLNGSSLTIQGSNATSLTLFNTKQTSVSAFGAATSINIGASTGTFSVKNATIDFTNATTFGVPKATTINIGTDAAGAVTTTIGKAGVNNTLNLNGSTITLASTSTGTLNLFNTGITTANILGAASTIAIGKSNAQITFTSEKEATSSTSASARFKGGVVINKKLLVDGDTTLGDTNADTTTIRGKVTLTDNNSTYPLVFQDVNVYRSDSNTITIGGHVVASGVSNTTNITTATTTNYSPTSTSVNIASTGTTTTVKGNFVVDGTTELKGTTEYILFKNHTSPRTKRAGELYYGSADDSLLFTPSDTNVQLSIGQELYARVKNISGATIENGTVVYSVVAGDGQHIGIKKAQADSESTSGVLGVTTHSIANNAFGFVTIRGRVDMSVSGLSAGKAYLSASTAGALTSTPPTGNNFVVEIGDVETTGFLYVNVRQSWTGTSTYNNMRVRNLITQTKFTLPTSLATASGGEIAQDAGLIKHYYNSAWRTLVDTGTTQSLTNKTYNGLTLTSASAGFTIAGGTSSRTATIAADLEVTTGKVKLVGNASGSSSLTLANSAFTLQSLTSGHVLYASAANTISSEAQLSVSRGGTGLGSFDSNYIYKGNGTGALVKSVLSSDANGITLDASKNLTLPSGSGVISHTYHSTNVIPGYSLTSTGAKSSSFSSVNISNETTSSTSGIEKRAIYASTSGNWVGDAVAIYAQAVGGGNNYSFYGASGTLVNTNDIITDGTLQARGGSITSNKSTFNFLTSTVTSLKTLEAANAIFTIGKDDTSTRTTNMYADMNIGSTSKARTVNHFGQFNFGGPTGFTASYNTADGSIDFIKL